MAPRLKPLKDENELAAIPVDQPVLVELEPVATGVEENAAASAADETAETETQRTPDKPTSGEEILRQQLEAAQAATAEANRIAAEERAGRAKAEKDAADARAQGADREVEAIDSGLAGAQAEASAAEADLKAAYDAGDSDKLAKAQRRLARAEASVVEYEKAQSALAARKDRDKSTDTTTRTAPTLTVEATIDAMPNLMDAERKWLKAHSDVIVDPRRNARLGVAYEDAMTEGLVRGTPEYFGFIEERMGYKAKPKAAADIEDNDEERTSIVTAPVTRENRSSFNGRPTNPNQVRLTPEQRQMARDMGLSDVQYAQGVKQLNSAKAADPAKFAGRQ